MPDKSKSLTVYLRPNGSLKAIMAGGDAIGKTPWKSGHYGYRKAILSWHLPNKKGMGRAKGNSLERHAAKFLSMWIYKNTFTLRRTPLSGGWASSKAGDIVVDHERLDSGCFNPRMYVECRNYCDILHYDMFSWAFRGKPKTLSKWIDEVTKKAKLMFPMLIIKGNHTEPWVVLDTEWLTKNTLAYFKKKAKAILIHSSHRILMIPLEIFRHLSDGESILRKWREDVKTTNGGRYR